MNLPFGPRRLTGVDRCIVGIKNYKSGNTGSMKFTCHKIIMVFVVKALENGDVCVDVGAAIVTRMKLLEEMLCWQTRHFLSWKGYNLPALKQRSLAIKFILAPANCSLRITCIFERLSRLQDAEY